MRESMKRYLCGLLVLVILMSCAPMAHAANTWNSDLLAVYWDDVPVYDGTGKEPQPTIAYQGLILAEGRDYVLTYSNNVNSGNQAQLHITGKGQYEGNSKTVNFVILPADIGKCRMEFSPAMYCGAPVTSPSHSIRDSKGNVLKENVDYVLTYWENTQVGEGRVRVIGLGNYTGYADCTFSIAAGTGEPVTGKFYVDLSADQDLNGKEYYLEAGSRLVLVMEASPNITELNVNGKPHPYFDPNALELYYNNIEPGHYNFQYSYLDQEQKTQSASFSVHVIRTTPVPAGKLIAGAPVRQGSKNVYLSVHGQKETEAVAGAVWTCTTPGTAQVGKDGVAVLKQPGIAMFSVTAGGQKATCGMDVDPWDISQEGRILNYDLTSETILVTWKNEILTEDIDYCVTTTDLDGATVVMVEGINLFTGFLSGVYYPLTCGHDYRSSVTAPTCTAQGYTTYTCTMCGDSYKGSYVNALGHKEVTDAAVAATCTKDGLTEGKHCSVCGTVTVKQQTVKAAGHSFANGKCSVCGEADPDYVKPTEPKPTEPEGTEPKPTEPDIQKDSVTRVFGADRYATAFKVADALKEELGVSKFQNIVVASGIDFPDALAGSYLATQKNAPILLVRGKNVAEVKAYIHANLKTGGTVYLLGGPNAVPKTMETGLEGFKVKRLGGATRYDTNLLILAEAGVAGKDILVCTGLDFADSLSASACGMPILLVKDGLFPAQKAFLAENPGKKIIIGGAVAVNATVEKQLKAYGQVERLAGSTRYETSVLVARTFFDAPERAVVAYAQNFPDGLCGGALAYQLHSPLILTAVGKDTAAVSYAADNDIHAGYVLGGTGLINDKTVRKIFAMAADEAIPVK